MRSTRNLALKQWRFISLSAAIIVLAMALVVMGKTVRDQLDLIRAAPHDNMQWTLSQLDVENSRLSHAIDDAIHNPDNSLDDLRRRFDLYYSRSEVITAMRSSSYLPKDADVNALLSELQTNTRDLALLIDQSENGLRDQLIELRKAVNDQVALIRVLTIQTVELFAKSSDARREALSHLLFQIFVVATLMTAALILVVFLLYRSNREAKNAQRRLSNVTARLQSTIGASLDAVIVSDRNGFLLDYNGAAEDVFGYSKEEVLGKNALELFIPEDERQETLQYFRQHLETGASSIIDQGLLQLDGLKKGGTIIPIEVSITSSMDHDKPIFISFVRDISERLAAGDALRKSRDEAVKIAKAKSDFIAVMSHEMRTPLNGVIAAHEILASTEFTPLQLKFLGVARSSATHLLKHVNDVLDISKMDADFAEPREAVFRPLTTLTEVIENAQSLARERGNSLEFDFKGADATYYSGDERRFRRILLNLIGNAIKFTSDGVIRVDFGISPKSAKYVCLELHVTDSGKGIPKERHADIFKDFVRLDASYDRDTEGTGLGLSITRRMVHSMGGSIGVESDLGKGSTFWVRLPLTICAQPPILRSPDDPVLRGSLYGNAECRRVLLVEDNEINRTIMEQFLKEAGLEVETAINGKLGLEIAQKNKFDFIFMDVSMPVMDGITATRLMRATREGASFQSTIIGYTAQANEVSLTECLNAGMDSVLVKPVKRAEIHAALGYDVASKQLPTQGESAIWDIEQIADIREILGPTKFATICAQFASEMRVGLDQLDHTLESETFEMRNVEQTKLIHALAGLSASMGARALHKRLEAAQLNAQSNELEQLKIELSAASTQFEIALNSDAYDFSKSKLIISTQTNL